MTSDVRNGLKFGKMNKEVKSTQNHFLYSFF